MSVDLFIVTKVSFASLRLCVRSFLKPINDSSVARFWIPLGVTELDRRLNIRVQAFVHRAVEGWQLSSIITFVSGDPLNLTSSVLTMGNTRIQSVPDAVGPISKDLGKVEKGNGFVQYFPGISSAAAPLPDLGSDPGNLKAVYSDRVIVDSSGKILLANAQPGKVGTLGLRYLQGPSHFLINLGVGKRTQIREGTTFTLRADMVNVLNQPQWGDPNVDINSASFGRITCSVTTTPGTCSAGQSTARTITINARINF